MKIKFPTVMINFKTYETSSGNDAVELAKICKIVAKETNKSVSVCASALDLYRTSRTKIPVIAQHMDIEGPGGHTGKNHVKPIIENGASGIMINHSEDRIPFKKIQELVALAKEQELFTLVCTKDARESAKVAKLNPDCIAVEPPQLIGGDISVTKADPKIISDTVAAVAKINPNIPVLCGAGVKNGSDVKIAIKLGAQGVLVASGVTKAKNQKKAVESLVKGMK